MNFYYTIRIAQILMQYEDVSIISITNREVEAIINDIKVNISGEICACHGGRLSIDVNGLGHTRIEYAEYTEERKDGDSEMSYAIENDMLPAIENLFNFKYIVTTKSPYVTTGNWNEPRYCSTFDSVLGIIGMNSHVRKLTDYTDLVVGLTEQHPNPKCKSVIANVEDMKNGLCVEVKHLNSDYKNKDDSYFHKITLTRKGKFKFVKKENEK